MKIYIKKLNGVSKILDEIVSIEIDFLNLLAVYRCTKYFDNYDFKTFINYGKHIDRDKIKKIVEDGKFQNFDELIENTPYHKILSYDTEQDYRKYMYKKYKKCFREGKFDISLLISYFALRQYEQRNIINILEGIRYKMDKEEIRKKITV